MRQVAIAILCTCALPARAELLVDPPTCNAYLAMPKHDQEVFATGFIVGALAGEPVVSDPVLRRGGFSDVLARYCTEHPDSSLVIAAEELRQLVFR